MSAIICFSPTTSRCGLDSNVFAFETRIVDRKLHPPIIAEIYSGYLPCSVLAGVYTGRSVTDRASRCRCALRYQPTFGHLPAMPQYSDISSTSAAGSTPYFASHYQGSYCL